MRRSPLPPRLAKRPTLASSVLLTLLVSVAVPTTTSADPPRTWNAKQGNFQVQAEYVRSDGARVVLRKSDGEEITVPISKLSDRDRAYVIGLARDAKKVETEVQDIATRFFTALREPDRNEAGKWLTAEAQRFLNAKPNHLSGLPKPDPGKRSIRVAAPEISDGIAEVPTQVRVGKVSHATKLHLRNQDSDGWRIFALSAKYPDGQRSIEFESPPEKSDEKKSWLGQSMPLSGITQAGTPLNMQTYAGKVVLVDFWATWCGPCRAEMPNILDNYKKYHDQGFEVVAISLDRNMESLEKFIAKENPPWVVVADRHPDNSTSMASRYQIRAIPSMFLIDRDGKIVSDRCRGKRLGQELAKLFP